MKPLNFQSRRPVDSYEFQKVTELRLKGRSWQDVASAIGRSVSDTRRIHDPLLPVIVAPPEPAKPPVPEVIVFPKHTAMDQIMAAVLERYGVTREEIVSFNRKPAILHARQAFCALAHDAVKSYPKVAAYLGRHHTVILHAARRHRARVAMQEAA